MGGSNLTGSALGAETITGANLLHRGVPLGIVEATLKASVGLEEILATRKDP